MQEALTILHEMGHEFGLGAEIARLITLMRQYERLNGELTGVALILDWLESAVTGLSALADVFHPTSQTAAHFRHEAGRLRAYVDRLRTLGFFSTRPQSIHEPLAGVGRD
jgi:hypothetical protein